MSSQLRWLLNLYQPCALGLNRTAVNCGWPKGWLTYDPIMQHFFGCPPFTSGNPPINFHEATDRIVYVPLRVLVRPFGPSLKALRTPSCCLHSSFCFCPPALFRDPHS